MTGDKFVSLALAVIIVSVLLSSYMHEMAHVQINKQDGVASHIEIRPLELALVTVAHEPYSDKARVVHGVNEAIGYQLLPLLAGIMVMQFVTLAWMVNKDG